MNYLTPGKDGLEGKSNPLHLIIIYVALRFLQGGGTGKLPAYFSYFDSMKMGSYLNVFCSHYISRAKTIDIVNYTREGIVMFFFSKNKRNAAIWGQIQVPDARRSAFDASQATTLATAEICVKYFSYRCFIGGIYFMYYLQNEWPFFISV